MGALTTTQIGSIVYTLIAGIPTGISGLMTTLTNQSVYMVNNYTGDSVQINSVDDKFQPAVTNLTISNVLSLMEAQGLGTKSISVGELSISKGMVEGTSQNYKKLAYNQLDDLGAKTSYYQTYS